MRSLFSVAVGLLILAVPMFAQRYDHSVTVNVVEIPVYVERFGFPVRGLTREDFELFVNGERHPIDYFEVIGDRADDSESGPSVAPVDLKRRQLTVLLFDLGSSRYSLRRARVAAAKVVAGASGDDTYAVATIGRLGVRFIVPFTNDRVAVQRAIATLTPSAARDPFRVATLHAERRSQPGEALGRAETASGRFGDIWGSDLAPGGFQSSLTASAAAGFRNAALDLENMEQELDRDSFMDSLTELADRLAPLDGLKQVVLLSTRRDAGSAAYSWEGGVLNSAVRLHKRYREAGVILNAVDIREPVVPGGAALSLEPGPIAPLSVLTSNFLHTLAIDTGGVATSSLAGLHYRHRLGYLVGFRPPSSRSKNNSVRIALKNRGLFTDVRYRKSYTLGGERRRDDGLFLADLLLNDIPQNGVSVDLRVQGTWLAASVPGVEMLANPSDEPLHLDVYFYVFDEERRPVAWNRLQIAVDLEKGREFLSTSPYTMRQHFDLESGRYVAKALVRVVGTDKIGFRRAEFVVPKPR